MKVDSKTPSPTSISYKQARACLFHLFKKKVFTQRNLAHVKNDLKNRSIEDLKNLLEELIDNLENPIEVMDHILSIIPSNSNPKEMLSTLLEALIVRLKNSQKEMDFSKIPSNSNPQILKTVLEELIDNLENSEEMDHILSKILSNSNPQEMLKTILEMLIVNLENPLEEMDHIFSKIPSNSNPKKMLSEAKKMIKSAQYFLDNSQKDLSPPIKAKLYNFLETIQSFLETILNSLGIADFLKPSEGELHSQMKFSKIMMLLSLFTMITTSLLPLLGIKLGAPIVAGVFLTIAIMSIIYPHFRPFPLHLPKGENWSKRSYMNQLSSSKGRETVVKNIADVLCSGTYPLLIGPSGIGKTETVKAFVNALEKGEFPELKGKRVFYFNTADLVNNQEMFGGGNNILSNIKNEIGRHRSNVILVFDEIHLACKDLEGNVIGDQLKTMLDDKFAQVIGLTTSEEFYRYIYQGNSAFARRFTRIPVETMSKEDTIEALNRFLLEEAPEICIEPGAIEFLFDHTEGTSQPLSALKILTVCLKKVKTTQMSTNAIELEKIDSKLRSLYSLGATTLTLKSEEIDTLEKELDRLKEIVNEEKMKIEHLFQTCDLLYKSKVALHRLIVKVSALQQDQLSAQDKRDLNTFWFLRNILKPALESSIKEKEDALGVNTHLTCKLIEEVIQEEKANVKKEKAALLAGKNIREVREERLEVTEKKKSKTPRAKAGGISYPLLPEGVLKG